MIGSDQDSSQIRRLLEGQICRNPEPLTTQQYWLGIHLAKTLMKKEWHSLPNQRMLQNPIKTNLERPPKPSQTEKNREWSGNLELERIQIIAKNVNKTQERKRLNKSRVKGRRRKLSVP